MKGAQQTLYAHIESRIINLPFRKTYREVLVLFDARTQVRLIFNLQRLRSTVEAIFGFLVFLDFLELFFTSVGNVNFSRFLSHLLLRSLNCIVTFLRPGA